MPKRRDNDQKPDFYRRLEVLCTQNGLSPSGLASKIGLSEGAAASWNRGVMPGGKTIVAMAKELKTSTDYLLTGVAADALTTQVTPEPMGGVTPILEFLEKMRADLQVEKQGFHQEKMQYQEIQKGVVDAQREIMRLQKDVSDTSKTMLRAAERLVEKIEQLSLFGSEPVKGGKIQK